MQQNQFDNSQPAIVKEKPTIKLCDYRHEQIKDGAKLQVQMLEHMGMTRKFSLRKLFMFGCDYAFSFIERISDRNPEEFTELLNDDNTTQFVVAYQKNEKEYHSTPLWTIGVISDSSKRLMRMAEEKDMVSITPLPNKYSHDEEIGNEMSLPYVCKEFTRKQRNELIKTIQWEPIRTVLPIKTGH